MINKANVDPVKTKTIASLSRLIQEKQLKVEINQSQNKTECDKDNSKVKMILKVSVTHSCSKSETQNTQLLWEL